MQISQRDRLVTGRATGVSFNQCETAVNHVCLHLALDDVKHLRRRARGQTQALPRPQHERVKAQYVFCIRAGLRVGISDLHLL